MLAKLFFLRITDLDYLRILLFEMKERNPVPLEVEYVLPAPFPLFLSARFYFHGRGKELPVSTDPASAFQSRGRFLVQTIAVTIPFPRPREGCWSREVACTHEHCKICHLHVAMIVACRSLMLPVRNVETRATTRRSSQ